MEKKNELHIFLQLVAQYPFIAKTLRDIEKPHEERKHCCGMTIQSEGIGYRDLDELFTKPCNLEFIIGKTMRVFYSKRLRGAKKKLERIFFLCRLI